MSRVSAAISDVRIPHMYTVRTFLKCSPGSVSKFELSAASGSCAVCSVPSGIQLRIIICGSNSDAHVTQHHHHHECMCMCDTAAGTFCHTSRCSHTLSLLTVPLHFPPHTLATQKLCFFFTSSLSFRLSCHCLRRQQSIQACFLTLLCNLPFTRVT